MQYARIEQRCSNGTTDLNAEGIVFDPTAHMTFLSNVCIKQLRSLGLCEGETSYRFQRSYTLVVVFKNVNSPEISRVLV